jgi:hypothetical protein
MVSQGEAEDLPWVMKSIVGTAAPGYLAENE